LPELSIINYLQRLYRGRTPERFYDALEWLYGWRAENSLTH
jgi:hypothetical protein